jgi:NDP-sugar pyrophosphorylase family protein
LSKVNVLIPMAGLGSRFADSGYRDPKPMIDVNGKPMIAAVIDSLDIDAQYIFIVQQEHINKYSVDILLSDLVPGCRIVSIDGITEGAASTTLHARHIIDNDTPLVIANSDQIVEWDSVVFKTLTKRNNVIATFVDESMNPKWSFSKLHNAVITEVAEKDPISQIANVGIYGWSKGSDYVKYAQQMIEKNIRTNNEFYIAPVYNEAIADGKIVMPYFVDAMHGVGTPEDLEEYLDKNRT